MATTGISHWRRTVWRKQAGLESVLPQGDKMTQLSAPKIFVVMAAYNEAEAIRPLVDSLLAAGRRVIVVDDASTDGTAEVLKDSPVYLLRHCVNRGQGAALQTGIEFALSRGAEIVVTFDADGQHDVQEIPEMVAPILAGECEITLGSRFLGRTEGMPLTRKLVLKVAVLFTRVFSRIRLTDIHNGFRAFSARAAARIHLQMDRMAHASEILDQIRQSGLRYREVPVTIRYTSYSIGKGQSSWNAVKIACELLLRRRLG
jgi:polyprenyl-phospho-N-acetylgalactosaminyl synthase